MYPTRTFFSSEIILSAWDNLYCFSKKKKAKKKYSVLVPDKTHVYNDASAAAACYRFAHTFVVKGSDTNYYLLTFTHSKYSYLFHAADD